MTTTTAAMEEVMAGLQHDFDMSSSSPRSLLEEEFSEQFLQCSSDDLEVDLGDPGSFEQFQCSDDHDQLSAAELGSIDSLTALLPSSGLAFDETPQRFQASNSNEVAASVNQTLTVAPGSSESSPHVYSSDGHPVSVDQNVEEVASGSSESLQQQFQPSREQVITLDESVSAVGENEDDDKCLLCRFPIGGMKFCDGINVGHLRNFFAGMNIFDNPNQVRDAANISFPFCAPCRDKIVMMSLKFDAYVRAKDDFESCRNDLAFTSIDSGPQFELSASENAAGPADEIRRLIYRRWITLYQAESRSNDLFSMTREPKTGFSEN